jgi:hypothetical protein
MSKFISLRDAVALLRDEALLQALKDGDVKARGRFWSDTRPYAPDRHYSDILEGNWQEGGANFEDSRLEWDDVHPEDGRPLGSSRFFAIQLYVAGLREWVKETLQKPDEQSPNKEGRPPKPERKIFREEMARRLDIRGERVQFESRTALMKDMREWYEKTYLKDAPDHNLVARWLRPQIKSSRL